MDGNALLQRALYLVLLLALVKPVGGYIARVYESRPVLLERVLGGLERFIYRASGVRPEAEMGWKAYAAAMLTFNLAGMLALYGLQRLQGLLPLNPERFGAVAPDLAFNNAAGFLTTADWQSYAGEATMSYLSQMLGLAVQNFLAAATGMAIMAAVIRAFARNAARTLGNFWVDLTRTTLYILLPLSIGLALILVSQGVVQTLGPYPRVALVQAGRSNLTEQILAVGPAASQIAIKQLGTNGGGFFNANSAHPFENPTPISNFFEMLAILLIPAALCYTFGVLVGDRRQGGALLAAMTLMFVGFLAVCVAAEQRGHVFAMQGVDHVTSALQSGGNMEGKEVRFGIVNSALWAVATTASGNGSVNAMLDSFTPMGGVVPLALIQLGEVVFGGVGGRFWVAVPVLAVAGSLVAKKRVPAGAGTLPTATPVFVLLLVGIVLFVGALTYLPALALGPLVEHLSLIGLK